MLYCTIQWEELIILIKISFSINAKLNQFVIHFLITNLLSNSKSNIRVSIEFAFEFKEIILSTTNTTSQMKNLTAYGATPFCCLVDQNIRWFQIAIFPKRSREMIMHSIILM